MTTLERRKKSINKTSTTAEQIREQPLANTDDLMNDPLLESLSNEPMDYNLVDASQPQEHAQQEICCLSTEVVQSLQSVKHICLTVLDLLLLDIVKDLPKKHNRSLSHPLYNEPTSTNLLGSITQNTNLLHALSMPASPNMTRSKSSPPATNISDVYRILDSNHHRHIQQQDYTLACSLAALLNDVYRLLELNSTTNQTPHHPHPIAPSSCKDVSLLHKQLHDEVSLFRHERAAGIMSIDERDATQEMIILWDEMDHLMDIVSKLAIEQQQQHQQCDPPAYDDSKHHSAPPPAYEAVPHIHVQEKKHVDTISSPSSGDLNQLLSAIDRLSLAAPRLNNQRVCLSENQLKELAAATLGKTVERLSRGRMENQRACLPGKSKHEILLQDLVQQIQKSASRSLDNQRVGLTAQQQKKMDFASLKGVMTRLDKGRFSDQDWISHEELLINDLTKTTDLLVKSLNRPAYNRQRFTMSAAKERSLFMSSLFNKVESLEGHRLINQDAERSKTATDEDLQQLLNNIYKSTKPQLNDQRASFTL